MNYKQLMNMTPRILFCLVAILNAQPAIACSVCYGDPNSPITKGVEAGVLVLLGVVVGVLTLLASLLLFWMRRAAILEGADQDVEEANAVV